MINKSEDALICDFAEAYQIYDYKLLPVKLAATFAAGLREDSRIKLLMRGAEKARSDVLLAMILDSLSDIFGDDKGKRESLAGFLLGINGNDKSEKIIGYKTPEAFEEAINELRKSR